MQRSAGAGRHVPEREATARSEDAARLGVEPALVRDVHLDVLADHDVEGGRVEWKLGDVGSADLDHVTEPDRVVEPFRDLAILGCEVYGGDSRAPLGGDQPGGPTDSGAGVEHAVACADLCEVDQGGGGEAAEAMEVLEHRKVGWLERDGLLTGIGQGPFDVGASQAGGVGLFERRRHGMYRSLSVY